ncbi:hypothetical protein [Intestinibacter bartlettii]|uniref:hypothetical protein n=1 Tax=Intestinibacter bartlettii TaxID=261299 RepID=UPI0022E3D0A8|nr:hypothetical protein [Intestinibacter bartlettii]
MGIIFSLAGSKAVGKSTLIEGLRQEIPQLIIREGFRKANTGFNLNIENEYYENERWYINREIKEFYKLKKCEDPVLLLRGPEDLEFFALHYPKTRNYNWNVEKNLSEELKVLRACRSDYILYLDASLNTILKRKESDITKARKNMDNWLKNWQPYIEPYIKNIDYTTVLNTENYDAKKVLELAKKWIMEKI